MVGRIPKPHFHPWTGELGRLVRLVRVIALSGCQNDGLFDVLGTRWRSEHGRCGDNDRVAVSKTRIFRAGL